MRLLIEATIAVLLLSVVIARADSGFGTPGALSQGQGQGAAPQPASTAKPAPPPPAGPTGTPTSQPTSRSPSSLDTQNTYHTNGGFLLQSNVRSKEPVIDGKSIPKTIEFSPPGDTKTAKPAHAEPRKKRPAARKPRRGRGQAEKPEKDEEDDGL